MSDPIKVVRVGMRGPTGLAGGNTGVGTFAARPVAGNAGKLYMPTDGRYLALDDGSAWRPMINGRLGKEPPTVAAGGWTTFGSPTLWTDKKGRIQIQRANPGSGYAQCGAYRSLVGDPWDPAGKNVDAFFSPSDGFSNALTTQEARIFYGVMLLCSSTHQFVGFALGFDCASGLSLPYAMSWVSHTTTSTGGSFVATGTYAVPQNGGPLGIQIQGIKVSGTNYVSFSVAPTKDDWAGVVGGTLTAASLIGSDTPDKVGVFCVVTGAQARANATIDHWDHY